MSSPMNILRQINWTRCLAIIIAGSIVIAAARYSHDQLSRLPSIPAIRLQEWVNPFPCIPRYYYPHLISLDSL